MNKLQHLEPQKAFEIFEAMCQIPHGSGNEKGLSDYLVVWAKARGLAVTQDAAYNVLIKKGGTKGYENAPAVILQGHIDMVCEKNNDTEHDFEKDPLDLHIDGDFVKAKGTTLGGDNCAGLALALALLDVEGLSHPPLEILCTTGEEVGLQGAAALDGSLLAGTRLLNLDSAAEGNFVVGCAGGVRAYIILPAAYVALPAGYASAKVSVTGLLGGHSGGDIHLERGNSNILMGRLLQRLLGAADLYVSDVNGGAQDNAIPREAAAIVSFPAEAADVVKAALLDVEKYLKNEYRTSDPGLALTFEMCDAPAPQVFDKGTANALVTGILLFPNGVQAKSVELENLTETSNNLGVIQTEGDTIRLTGALRSSVVTRKELLLTKLELLAAAIGAKVETIGAYPGWAYAPQSPLRDRAIAVYEVLRGKKPTISAIHGGLECGILAEKIPGVDIISFGPDVFDYHTPEERLSIASFKRTWEFLVALLAQLDR